MKIAILALMTLTISLSSFADSHVCVTKKGLVTRMFEKIGMSVTALDMAPYQKGDFVGSAVYKVVADSNVVKVISESRQTKLVQTKEEIKVLKKDDGLDIGSFRLIDFSQYTTVQKPEWELVQDGITTEVVDAFSNPSDVNKYYNTVACPS